MYKIRAYLGRNQRGSLQVRSEPKGEKEQGSGEWELRCKEGSVYRSVFPVAGRQDNPQS